MRTTSAKLLKCLEKSVNWHRGSATSRSHTPDAPVSERKTMTLSRRPSPLPTPSMLLLGLSLVSLSPGCEGEPSESPSPDPSPAVSSTPSAPTASPQPTPTETPRETEAPTATPALTPTATPSGPPYLGQTEARAPYGEGVVIVEPVRLPSVHPPANPSPGTGDTGPAQSPEAYDFATFNRYRYADSTRPVEVILLGMPGFQGGAGDYDYIGRALVALGEGRIEVWAIDRRSNQLEDHEGTEAAEQEQQPAEALNRGLDYYFRGTDEGGTFAGFVQNEQIPYFSEWGLDLTLRDAYTMLQAIPESHRQKVAFLAGHSLGGSIVQSFAAWDFDGDPSTEQDAGYQQLAGLLLLDGAVDPSPDRVTEQASYEETLAGLRAGSSKRTASFAGLSADVNVLLELFALSQTLGPAEEAPVSSLYDVEGVNVAYLTTLYGEGRFTYRAMLGLAVDDNFQTAYVFQSSAGFLSGGPVESYRRGNKTYYRPASEDGTVLYGWLDYNEVTDEVPDQETEEATHIDDVAYACFKGPANFTEWYFPSRLSADIGPVSDLNVSTAGEDWRWNVYQMAAIHNGQVDIPVLGYFSDESFPSTGLSNYQSSIAQTLRDGSARSEGFEINVAQGYEHLDVLLADLDHPTRPNIVLSRLPEWFSRFGLYGQNEGVPVESLNALLSGTSIPAR